MFRFYILILLFSLPSLSFAGGYYEKGNYICEDFEEAEHLHNKYPDRVGFEIMYAECLIVKGPKYNEDKGLAILHNVVNRYGDVGAAFTIADYERTGGTFEKRDENKINEAIDGYQKVKALIRSNPYYPFPNPHIPISNSNGFHDDAEAVSQRELRSHYFVPSLYFDKYKKGAKGTDNVHLLRSPSYKGRRDLNTYPDYAPYTEDSLERMIEYANDCLALPPKDHFRSPKYYRDYLNICQIYKDTAEELLPLEGQRLVLLLTESCSSDLPKCEAHRVLKAEIVSIIKQSTSEINGIFRPYLASK